MDDEFEIGLELDRALRAAVTGVAQLVERGARVRTDSDRTSAAAARQEWLGERDAARWQYEPWVRPGAVEKAPAPLPAAQAWAVAAAWSEMDPTAALAERSLAERIGQTHGEHPSVLLQRASAAPGATLTKAPQPVLVELELDEQRAQWEAWAVKAGAGEEFDVARWRDGEGTIDEAARDAALVRLWDAGSGDRALLELEEHQAAMTAAGMGELPAHIALPDAENQPQATQGVDAGTEAGAEAREPAWAALLTAEAFEAAEPQEVARAWREARSQGLDGAAPDLVAQAAAEQLAREIDRKYARHPEALLRETLAERASAQTESRRDAEDAARVAGEDLGATALDEPAQAATVGRYDRAEEADLESLTPQSRQARVASSHGFSQSTEDMLAKPARGATPARPNKGGLDAPKKARSFKR